MIANMLYVYSKYVAIEMENKEKSVSTKWYDPKRSIQRARNPKWRLQLAEGEYEWSTQMDRVNIIRKGLPYESFEVLSKRADLPVKQVLQLFGIPQTTYNKKKKDKDLLSGRDSEVVLVLTELLDFGLEVFNDEKEKFQRWLKKPNISLGEVAPESLFDSLTGIQEVKNCLNRLEYGNLA
jgi:putative toxin-antitoxin system antitoxin component (TIGR02293 family)